MIRQELTLYFPHAGNADPPVGIYFISEDIFTLASSYFREISPIETCSRKVGRFYPRTIWTPRCSPSIRYL